MQFILSPILLLLALFIFLLAVYIIVGKAFKFEYQNSIFRWLRDYFNLILQSIRSALGHILHIVLSGRHLPPQQ